MIYRNKIFLLLICIAALTASLLYLRSARAEDAQLIAPNDKETCLACHSEKVNSQHFTSSAHGRLNCQVCHAGIDRFPHPEQAVAQKPACTSCHAIKAASLAKSVHQHADAKTKAPLACQSCHGNNAHEILEASKLGPEQQVAPCTTCHRKVVNTLQASAHGHSGNTVNGIRPNCLSCHGSNPHEINSPKGISAAPSDQSCRSCHTDIAKMLLGSAHGQLGMESSNRLSCLTCHGASAHAVSPLKHGSAAATSQRCVSCHPAVASALSSSAHSHLAAQGKTGAPTCTDCHGDNMHAIKKASEVSLQQKDLSCRRCHTQIVQTLAQSVHGHAGNGKEAPSCLSCHWGSSHTIKPPAAMDRQQQEASCKRCHSDLAKSLENSVHDRPDRKPGDHPTCLSCHGGVAHNISQPKHLTPRQRVELCSKCHNDQERMARYGMTTGAVSSYDQSFHGRAVMRFGKKNTATCTDCHGLHGVLAPNNPDAPTNQQHVAATCGKCHAGAKLNFALSGANHLRLRIQSSPILLLEEIFFQLLIFGTMLSLFGMVVLDLRRKAFSPGSSPEAGRFVSVLIAMSFMCLIAGIILAFLQVRGMEWVWLTSLALVIIALIVFAIQRKFRPSHPVGKRYKRLTPVMRIQHGLLALTFTLLVLTGLPLHFADVGWMHHILTVFGGFDGARVVHRVAGVTMVLNWLWHLAYLLYLWKKADFSLRSWTMLPTKKDVKDFIDNFKYGLGLRPEPPQYDRFQFREKFDYYADMWGTIVMGLTGFVLWFPTTLGNHLPNLAFGVSYIAHSYEGLLAMMAILVWHFYNTHFNPDTFPMNATFLTGTMTESEMAREHPLEKARIDAAEPAPSQGDSAPKVPSASA